MSIVIFGDKTVGEMLVKMHLPLSIARTNTTNTTLHSRTKVYPSVS